MPVVNADHEFVQLLGTLEGQEFQNEVCRFLQRCVNDFQPVPPKPQGDGSLDGYSHGQTVAYCCYGPEQEPSKVKARGLAADIIKKFRDDMRSLFELKPKGKNNLIYEANNEIKTILASGRKFKFVRLVVSVFDTHRILGPLNDAFEECRQASICAYVDKTASVTVWGPKELAAIGTVDDATIIRLRQREVLSRIDDVLANPPKPTAPPSTSDFDSKFNWLDAHGNPGLGGTSMMRAHFMKRWLSALAIEEDFANNSLLLHRALMLAREDAVIDAELESRTQPSAAHIIKVMREKLSVRLESAFATSLPPEKIKSLVDCELGFLIGLCPVEWRS